MSNSDFFRTVARAFGRGVFPHQLSWILDLPGRGLIMPARTVAARVPVRADSRVLEVGPGSGYYTVDVARRVPEGTLTLLDIQPEMLERCARKLDAAGVSRYLTVEADGAQLPFADGAFDVIFMVTVFGEIDERDRFLSEAYRVLVPGGTLSITEHHPDPDFESSEQVISAVERFGFVADEPIGWRWAFTVNARRGGHAPPDTGPNEGSTTEAP